MELFALPESTLRVVARFLLGIDLFRLSHASSYALQTFSEDDLWRVRCLSKASDTTSAKQAYMQQHSFVFRGSQLVGEPCYVLEWRELFVTLPSKLLFMPMSEQLVSEATMLSHVSVPAQWADDLALSRTEAVSLDLWFSLAPDEPGCVRGGILLGGQSTPLGSGRWPYRHHQIALVDTQGHLYCSIVNVPKQQIATNLQAERWYHLALVWSNGLQRVYLDSKLVSELHGPLLQELGGLYHWQAGAGCISAGSVGKPHGTWCGWLGFRGVIDDFRVWDLAITDEQIAQLQRHGDLAASLKPVYSMKRDCGSEQEEAQSVRCSRPLEQSCLPWK